MRFDLQNVRWFSLFAALVATEGVVSKPLAPRVLIVVAFQDGNPPLYEAAPWYQNEGLNISFATTNGEKLRCNADSSACLLITGVGKVNAASSVLSLGLDPAIDLSRTYIIVSGIAGVSPKMGTVGTPAWAHWIVDYDLAHEIDSLEPGPHFAYSRFRQGCTNTAWCNGWKEGTEVYQLNTRLVDWALHLTKNAKLTDTIGFKTYRSAYNFTAAHRLPHVTSCDVVAGDAFWIGNRLGTFAEWWAHQWTQGKGEYCMSSMEDSAIAAAVSQLANLRRADYNKFLVLRTGSDFDRPHAHQDALTALRQGENDSFYNAAAANGYLTARIVERYILAHPKLQ